MKIKPHLATDFYKVSHRIQYPAGTQEVYSNFTARSTSHAKMSKFFDNKVVFFGMQGFARWFLIDLWSKEFFNRPKAVVIEEFRRRVDTSLGEGSVSVEQMEALWDLGYLPIEIKALPEGSRVNIKVPAFTVRNTSHNFGWLTNYLETVISAEIWKPMTVATIAHDFRRQLNHFIELTGSSVEFADWQNHDFSMRGMSGVFDAATCGAGVLLSTYGTDTIPAIDYLEEYYFADCTKELIGGSVPATEHSVMCMGGKDDEIGTFKRLINETYPTGVVSIVSDTWDFWKVITEYSATLKEDIMARKPNALGLAKVVFRPDSGDPVRILAGYREDEIHRRPHGIVAKDTMDGKYVETLLTEDEVKGAVQCLWEIFGGTLTDKGYQTLDQHVGLIYGDSITIDRQYDILNRLANKGFSAGNVVFGIGSYTFQYITRDTFGMAIKATSGVVNGERRELMKDPKTDSGSKRSACGLLRVEKNGSDYVLFDRQTEEQEQLGLLRTVFCNGEAFNEQSLADIRSILKND